MPVPMHLVAFLGALTDTAFLRDPRFSDPFPAGCGSSLHLAERFQVGHVLRSTRRALVQHE